jgi:hypothetical protein
MILNNINLNYNNGIEMKSIQYIASSTILTTLNLNNEGFQINHSNNGEDKSFVFNKDNFTINNDVVINDSKFVINSGTMKLEITFDVTGVIFTCKQKATNAELWTKKLEVIT